ncbi:MAG: hypothetical protein P1U46_03065 [Patescibacteria group bacterium]|nr:hypothetical protein [Patescibacteria group bacterium]
MNSAIVHSTSSFSFIKITLPSVFHLLMKLFTSISTHIFIHHSHIVSSFSLHCKIQVELDISSIYGTSFIIIFCIDLLFLLLKIINQSSSASKVYVQFIFFIIFIHFHAISSALYHFFQSLAFNGFHSISEPFLHSHSGIKVNILSHFFIAQ